MTAEARVFLSYSRVDHLTAREVWAGLRRLGHAVWIDEEGIRTGASARRTILGALQTRPVVLFLASASSVTRPWVAAELSFAQRAGSLTVVLLAEPVGLPLWLEPYEVIPMTNRPLPRLARVSTALERAWIRQSSSRL